MDEDFSSRFTGFEMTNWDNSAAAIGTSICGKGEGGLIYFFRRSNISL